MSILKKLLEQINLIINNALELCCSYYNWNDKELTLEVVEYIDSQLTYNFRKGLLLNGIVRHPEDFKLLIDMMNTEDETGSISVGIQYKNVWIQQIDDLALILFNEYIDKDTQESTSMY